VYIHTYTYILLTDHNSDWYPPQGNTKEIVCSRLKDSFQAFWRKKISLDSLIHCFIIKFAYLKVFLNMYIHCTFVWVCTYLPGNIKLYKCEFFFELWDVDINDINLAGTPMIQTSKRVSSGILWHSVSLALSYYFCIFDCINFYVLTSFCCSVVRLFFISTHPMRRPEVCSVSTNTRFPYQLQLNLNGNRGVQSAYELSQQQLQ